MKFLDSFIPNKKSRLFTPLVVLAGVMVGLGVFIVKESELISYASDSPQACVNCHVMTPTYNAWMHSSHREHASCNDCHVPHNNIFNKYYFKAKDGLYHSYVFTTRQEPEVMFMRDASEVVVQDNCVRCHVQQVTQTKYADYIEGHTENRTDRKCWSCHKEVPHGRVHGLSTIGYSIAPKPTDKEELVIPEWLQKEMK